MVVVYCFQTMLCVFAFEVIVPRPVAHVFHMCRTITSPMQKCDNMQWVVRNLYPERKYWSMKRTMPYCCVMKCLY